MASLTVDGTSVGTATSYPFSNVTANHTISATFILNTYTITPTAGANGTISPSSAVTVNSGASQTFTITPATGYQVASVAVDGSSVGTATSYPFSNVTANHTIAATFVLNTYTITPTAGANGTISPSSAVTVNSGASQTFTITPATGYQVASVTVDGSSVGTATSYPFSNVTANHTISATFAVNTYTITPTAGANGTISPSSAVTVNSGASQTFTITPASGYHVASLTVDGSSGRDCNDLSFQQRHGQPYDLSDIRSQYLHHHANCRGQRDDLPLLRRNGQLRGKPDLYDHPGFRLPCGDPHSGRIFGRGGNKLSLQQRCGQPYNLSNIRNQYLHHHANRRWPTGRSPPPPP